MTQDDGGVSLSGNGSSVATYTYPLYFLKGAGFKRSMCLVKVQGSMMRRAVFPNCEGGKFWHVLFSFL